MSRKDSWRNFTVKLLGIWVFLSPWFFAKSFSIAAGIGSANGFMKLNLLVAGALAAVFGFSAQTKFAEWKEWSVAILGGRLVALPWLRGTSTAMVWSTTFAGFFVMVLFSWMAYGAQATRIGITFSKSDPRLAGQLPAIRGD
jgi:hypothetical protein